MRKGRKAPVLTCTFNLERLDKGPENWRAIVDQESDIQYKDFDFPAHYTSLYWEGHTREDTQGVVRRYKAIKKWLRPSFLVNPGSKPSLWGTHGVKPDAV